jgi:alpha/beta superfamily hydrolase
MLHSDDGVDLEAELASPAGPPRASAVLCHPHPQFGGTMRSIVIGALFQALPAVGVSCLRFNFRGVDGSTGVFDEGRGEREDARAAVRALAERVPGRSLILIGWSFGADVALSVLEPVVAAWVAIAPPLRFVADVGPVASDPRAKLLLLAEHDEFRPPAEVITIAAGWATTEVEIVPGASHFFVGRTDRVSQLTERFVDGLTGAPYRTVRNA